MTGTEEHGTDRVLEDKPEFTSIEICAGAGGQAIGLHKAGFRHLALVEIDPHAGNTLEENIRIQPDWAWEKKYCDVVRGDVKDFDPKHDLNKSAVWRGQELDLLAGGVPCPPSPTRASSWAKRTSATSSRRCSGSRGNSSPGP